MKIPISKSSRRGTLAFPDTFFETPESPGWYTFTVQADAGALSSGRYYWLAEYGFHDATTDDLILGLASPTSGDFFAFQDAINRDDSEFGAGWQLPELDRLATGQYMDIHEYGYNYDEHGVSLITGDNRAIWFLEGSTNSETHITSYSIESNNPSGYRYTELERDNGADSESSLDDTYTLTSVDGSKGIFDGSGLLQSRVDRLGNVIAAYEYTDGLLGSITDVGGNETYFVHAGGLVTSTTDFYGTAGAETTTLGYDGSGRLTMVTAPDPDGEEGPLSSPVTSYDYYISGYRENLLKSIIDPRALETTIDYDFTRHVSEMTERCGGTIDVTSIAFQTAVDLSLTGYDKSHLATLIATTSTDNVTIAATEHRVEYGIDHDEYIARDASGQITSLTDAQGNVAYYTHDDTYAPGLLHTVIEPNPNGNGPLDPLTTTYTYNTSGQVTEIDHPIGSEHWGYDTFENVNGAS